MLLNNCKVRLKLKWTKCCVSSAVGTENVINEDANANNIIFTIKDTKLYFLELYQQETTKNYHNF